jgi:serine/threonine protein kinase
MTSESQQQQQQDASCFREELDSAGDTVRVANLVFEPGILGKGAYGTVRLAMRHKHSMQQQQQVDATDTKAMTTDGSASSQAATGTNAGTHGKSRRDNFGRSLSAPSRNDLFFHLTALEQNVLNKMHGPRSLLTRSRSARPSRFHSNNADDDESDTDHSDPENELVAVKIFQKSILKRMRTMERNKETKRMQVKTALQKVEREIALMKKLSHPNLVRFYEAIDSPDSGNIYMVIEYMPLGEILTYQQDGIFRRKEPKMGRDPIEGLVDGHFDEFHALLYFVDIMHGLAYLHQHHIIHRDLVSTTGNLCLYASDPHLFHRSQCFLHYLNCRNQRIYCWMREELPS